MKPPIALVVLAAGFASASLNCTALEDISYYSCADSTCDLMGTYKTGSLAQFGCASDNSTATDRWLWNYNGYYTKSTTQVENCTLNGREYPSTDVLPLCSKDTIVLNITDNAPLKPCVCHAAVPSGTPLASMFRV
ncbi:uncharacterized protein BP5553_08319 [Venustampulla echinocandica]|uniref:Secreted protein n=1 Tax=Venustampulla echinocandica TaxID=2656787 RepID=A0A370TGD8_9HELO|nr:uncharacterized protein BP5553_08319 [Venustampulla echinocandica]RDL33951.1 hypothetical protein BP5553_08319 [Venustampulla echinocandica]